MPLVRSQIARWTALAAYLIYSASGLLLVTFCPQELLPGFLTQYPLINSVASFSIMLLYTNTRSRAVDTAIAVSISAGILCFSIWHIFTLLLLSFVVTTVILDYSGAQSFSVVWQSRIRLVLAMSTVILPFSFVGFLVLRSVLSLALFVWSMHSKNYAAEGYAPSFEKAAVLLALNLVYFIPLYAIGAYLVQEKRVGYLLYAIVANILVRIMDFEAKLAVSGEGGGQRLAFHAVLALGLAAVAAFGALVTPAYLLMAVPLVIVAGVRRRYIRLKWS